MHCRKNQNQEGCSLALINCPECGHEVSDRAGFCPHCGCPLTKEPELATFMLKRESRSFGVAVSYEVYIDHQMIGIIKNGGMLKETLPCGRHNLRLIDRFNFNKTAFDSDFFLGREGLVMTFAAAMTISMNHSPYILADTTNTRSQSASTSQSGYNTGAYNSAPHTNSPAIDSLANRAASKPKKSRFGTTVLYLFLALVIICFIFVLEVSNTPSKKDPPAVSQAPASTTNANNTQFSTNNVTQSTVPNSEAPSASPQAPAAQSELSNAQYTANGITLSLSQPEYSRSWGGYYYTELSVRNDRDSDLYYEIEYALVNGYQMPVLLYGDVFSGMSSTFKVPFSFDDIKLAQIEHILDVEVCVRITESDSKEEIDTVTLSLVTPNAEKYTQSYDYGWPEVYNENGIRICARLGEDGESYPVVFFIENNSGTTVSISYDDIAVNGVMIAQMLTGVHIIDGAKSVTGMQRSLVEMMGGEIPSNKDIDSVVFRFSFLPIGENGSFSTANLYDSDKIVVSR